MVFDFLTPEALATYAPFIKGSLPAVATGIGVGANWLYQIWKQRQEDKIAAEDKTATIAERTDLAAQRKELYENLRERIKELEEQHDYDQLSVRAYQKYMVECHADILWLRQVVDALKTRLGDELSAWPPLPPLPQPNISP